MVRFSVLVTFAARWRWCADARRLCPSGESVLDGRLYIPYQSGTATR